MPGKSGQDNPVGDIANASQDDASLGDQFSAMSMTGAPRSKLQAAMKVRSKRYHS